MSEVVACAATYEPNFPSDEAIHANLSQELSPNQSLDIGSVNSGLCSHPVNKATLATANAVLLAEASQSSFSADLAHKLASSEDVDMRCVNNDEKYDEIRSCNASISSEHHGLDEIASATAEVTDAVVAIRA